MLFVKADDDAGSAVRAAGAMHASAHVHAVRYGDKGSKDYKRAYAQHVGRFLSCMRQFQKSDDEPRDAQGRWTVSQGRFSTGGITGLDRPGIIAKVRSLLDRHPHGVAGLIAGKTASMLAPPGVDHVDEHTAAAVAHVIAKVRNDPRFHRLAALAVTKASRLFRKALDPDDSMALKDHVARVVADTKFPPRIAYDDAALAQVAHGAYRHLHGRLCAQMGSLS